MFDLTLERLLLMAGFVFFAGFVDALAGGGGLVTLPAYLSLGLNPALVLGTNKIASSIGTSVSIFNYQRRQRLSWKSMILPSAACFVGSWIGARLATRLAPWLFQYFLLAALPVVAYLIYSKHSFGAEDRSVHLRPETVRRRAAGVAAAVGCYDGFFGPGAGTFFALGLTRFCRYDLLGATGRAKILNFSSNIAAMAAFLLAARAQIPLGLLMGAVSACGNYAGSHWGLKHGHKAIRPAVLFVCAGLFIKLLFSTVIFP